MDKTKPGAETGEYVVNIYNAINDVKLWRYVINGYPYKSIEELGVANSKEAFTATKQAIYCYIHGNNRWDYTGIGEAGERTLNAMQRIIDNAENSNQNIVSNNIRINKIEENWKQDELDKQYISKTYSVSSDAKLENYRVQVSKLKSTENGGIKIVDINNNEKEIFNTNENFKILIPIKETKDSGKIKIEVSGKVETKLVLYGTGPSGYQDYALTALMYEDGTGNTEDYFQNNETKIIIIKQDNDTCKRLEGVEFAILDSNRNVIYSGLVTDEEGKVEIKNMLPGTYYILEKNTIEGYEKYEGEIEIKLDYNEEYTVKINNKKEEKPKVEIEKNKSEKEVTRNKEITSYRDVKIFDKTITFY